MTIEYRDINPVKQSLIYGSRRDLILECV